MTRNSVDDLGTAQAPTPGRVTARAGGVLVSLSVILRRRGPALIGLIMLLVCSLPMTADRLWETLEADYPHRSIESTENADAVVVLSGMLEWLETEDSVVPQWGRPPTGSSRG